MTLCRHFGTCGGCALQDLTPDDYRARKRNEIIEALSRNGFDDVVVNDVISVPPRTRRRAIFKVEKKNSAAAIGFHAAKSHTIVDMHECLVITPALFSAVAGFREMFAGVLRENEKAELHVTETDAGLDVAIDWKRLPTPKLISEIAPWAVKLKLARVTSGDEILAEFATPQIQFGSARVDLPPEAFLQPTREGEAILQDFVLETTAKAKHIADLFAGCGTFSLPLAGRARVHAVELERAALNALARAARNTSGLKPVTIEPRDLFKRPLGPPELAPFDAVVLDPPRMGAAAQAKELAASRVARIAYVSCNAASFARDASILSRGGYRIGPVTPVDQFLWSSHTELAAAFVRDGT
jgi:23S rRNA (uracil1939-C5)-methyltransferase